jgi:uncharacterized coiled-coil DUF342 family protein
MCLFDILQDHTYAGNDKIWKKRCNFLEDKARSLTSTSDVSSRKIKRLQSRCKSLSEKLEDANNENAEMKKRLEQYSGSVNVVVST